MKWNGPWKKLLMSLTLTLMIVFDVQQGLTHAAQMEKPSAGKCSEPASLLLPAYHLQASQAAPGMFKELADYLSLEPKTLRKRLSNESLAEIAQKQGIHRSALKDKMVELMKSRVASKAAPLGDTMDFSAAAERLMEKKGGWHKTMRKLTRVPDIEGLAKVLNMTPEEIKQELNAGKTLAELAKQRGVSVQEVIDQQVKAITEHLDRHLAEGRITKERYEEKKSKIKPFITDFVYGKYQKPKIHYRHRSISNVPDVGE